MKIKTELQSVGPCVPAIPFRRNPTSSKNSRELPLIFLTVRTQNSLGDVSKEALLEVYVFTPIILIIVEKKFCIGFLS